MALDRLGPINGRLCWSTTHSTVGFGPLTVVRQDKEFRSPGLR
ncbi:MAG: hypothetical protein OJF62_002338 [Pseudolabrys sp.]|jgi:hypothetical protein|nr:hypothetical protein [Pseudolabrys sp.]